MGIFKPRKIVDPRTGKIRIISPEEQAEMLDKGILFDIPSTSVGENGVAPSSSHSDPDKP